MLFKSRSLQRAAFAIGVLGLAYLSWTTYSILQIRAFHADGFRIQQVLRDAQCQPPPPNCSEHLWDELWGFNLSCVSNIAFLEENISREQLGNLRQKVEQECRPPITVKTAQKVYGHFADSCPYGKKYTSQWQSDFDRFANAARGE
jgi:hypothetical protein